MQTRILKRLLNDTKYTVTNNDGHIAIGSYMVSEIIKVNKNTLEMVYAIGSGRESIKHKELESIWDTLQALIKSGEIRAIIDNDDVVANPLPVFTWDKGKIIETTTDAYGWPNVTVSGELMHDNTHFKTKAKAIKAAISDCGYGVENYTRRRDEIAKQLAEMEAMLAEEIGYLEYFKSLQKTDKNENN